jgi:succinate dehydrogenase/fumarate reductase flavoprotein subunit
MFDHNPGRGELGIEKARMALAIQQEIDAGRGLPDGTVLFDTTVLAAEKLESYVGHCKRLRAAGLDPAVEAPRVRPAAHSVMGGIRVDGTLRTDAPNLFAAGEAAGGVHGASRLAGNGAADVIVFGGLAGRHAADHAARASASARDRDRIERNALAPLQRASGGEGAPSPDDIRDAVRATLLEGAGLYRSREGLGKAIVRLEALAQAARAGLALRTQRDSLRALEAAHMVATGLHVARSALARTESRGAHQRTDHAARDDANWLRHVVVGPGDAHVAIQ